MYFLICRRSNVEKGLMWSICFGFVNTFTHSGTNTNSLHETESAVPSSFDKSRVFELVCFFLHPRHSCQQLFHWTSKTRKRHIEIKRKKKDTQMQFWPLSIHCVVSCQHWKCLPPRVAIKYSTRLQSIKGDERKWTETYSLICVTEKHA